MGWTSCVYFPSYTKKTNKGSSFLLAEPGGEHNNNSGILSRDFVLPNGTFEPENEGRVSDTIIVRNNNSETLFRRSSSWLVLCRPSAAVKLCDSRLSLFQVSDVPNEFPTTHS